MVVFVSHTFLLGQQIANIHTKGLLKQCFDYYISKLGLLDINAPTRGKV